MNTPVHVTLALDRLGWCFHRIALKLVEELCDEFSFRVSPHITITHGVTDILCALWWPSVLRLRANMRHRAIIPCIYDGLSWSIDDGARSQFAMVLRHSTVVAVCNEEFAEQIREEFDNCPPIMLIEDGVDTELFKPLPFPKKSDDAYGTLVGWTGNSARMTPGGPPDQKGCEFLKDVCKTAGVPLVYLDSSSGGAWPHDEMPDFYKDITWYACASHKEGTPNPVLEAMACGRPVISTPVGLVPKLVEDGVNGFIVPRQREAWIGALREIRGIPFPKLQKMGKAARKAAEGFSWKIKAEQFREAFRESIRISNRPRPKDVGAMPVPKPSSKAAPVRIDPPAPPTITVRDMPRPQRAVKKVLLISDVRGWAFHQNMVDLELSLSGVHEFKHWFVDDYQRHGFIPDLWDFDAVFCVYHRWPILGLLPWDRTVGSLRSAWFRPERPGPPLAEDITLVNQFQAFHLVTRESYDQVKKLCPNAVYLTNPVNTDRFPEPTMVNGLVLSWNGNGYRWPLVGDIKGYNDIIIPVVEELKVPFECAEYNTRRLEPDQMPAFYQLGSVALCMSRYEGASNSMMEAMASGLALITTSVGNVVEMQKSQLKHYGDTGILIVERSAQALKKAIVSLQSKPKRIREMGEINRKEIFARWSWKVWAERYDAFLRKAMQ